MNTDTEEMKAFVEPRALRADEMAGVVNQYRQGTQRQGPEPATY